MPSLRHIAWPRWPHHAGRVRGGGIASTVPSGPSAAPPRASHSASRRPSRSVRRRHFGVSAFDMNARRGDGVALVHPHRAGQQRLIQHCHRADGTLAVVQNSTTTTFPLPHTIYPQSGLAVPPLGLSVRPTTPAGTQAQTIARGATVRSRVPVGGAAAFATSAPRRERRDASTMHCCPVCTSPSPRRRAAGTSSAERRRVSLRGRRHDATSSRPLTPPAERARRRGSPDHTLYVARPFARVIYAYPEHTASRVIGRSRQLHHRHTSTRRICFT